MNWMLGIRVGGSDDAQEPDLNTALSWRGHNRPSPGCLFYVLLMIPTRYRQAGRRDQAQQQGWTKR